MDRTQIVDYLSRKMFDVELTGEIYYIMLKNKQIYIMGNYGALVKSNKILPEDAFVFIGSHIRRKVESRNDDIEYLLPLIEYLLPLIDNIYGIVDSYLAKLGFYNPVYSINPATGLKYHAVVVLFEDRLVIELTDIDIMATNTGLRKIVADVLGKGILTQREISWDQISEIERKLKRQKLFAGHDLYEVYDIFTDYYIYHKTSLAKEVLAITDAYNRIFQPYRAVYDTETRQQVLM